MPSAAPSADLFVALRRAFARLDAGWYVFGAQAVMLWGRPRLTADIDVTVRVPQDDATALHDALAAEGFALRIEGDEAFVRRTRVLPMAFTATRWPVDVVLAGPGLEEEFLERAVTMHVGGEPVPVICPEDLVVTKLLAGRPKDVEDIRGVLRERHERLDLALVRRTVRRVEQALGVSDLLPLFEAELARLR